MKRSVRLLLNVFSPMALLLGAAVVAYLISHSFSLRIDLTSQKMNSLSEKSIGILKELGSRKVECLAFFREGQPEKAELESLLREFAARHPHFLYRFIDPDRRPGEARAYGVDAYGITLIQRAGRRQKIRGITEEDLSNALLKLMNVERKVLYFSRGHGEPLLDHADRNGASGLRQKLLEENYEVKEVILSREGVPSDCDLLLIYGPKIDLEQVEINQIRTSLGRGGSVAFFLDPVEEFESMANIERFLKDYGVRLGHNVVVDKLSKLFGADYLIPVITEYAPHEITKNFTLASFLPIAQSIEPMEISRVEVDLVKLALTSQGSWAEYNLKGVREGQAIFEEGMDQPGPVSVALVVTPKNKKEKFKMVVLGDSDFANNAHLGLSGNKDLFLNIVGWLVGEESLVSIRPKKRKNTPLYLREKDQKMVMGLPVVALPLSVLSLGAIVHLYKRKHD